MSEQEDKSKLDEPGYKVSFTPADKPTEKRTVVKLITASVLATAFIATMSPPEMADRILEIAAKAILKQIDAARKDGMPDE